MCWWPCSVAVAPPKTRTQNNPTKFEFHGGWLPVSFFFEQTCFRHRGHRFTRFWFWLQQWICRISTQQKTNINLDTTVSSFFLCVCFFLKKWSHILIQLQDLYGILPSDLSRMTLQGFFCSWPLGSVIRIFQAFGHGCFCVGLIQFSPDPPPLLQL